MSFFSESRQFETKEERKQRIQSAFQQFDKNKNGTIEIDEIVQSLTALFKIENHPALETYQKFFRIIFKMCDKGNFFKRKDGVLNLQEFERIADAMPDIISRDVKTDIAKMIFNIIDANKSKRISKKETARFLKYSDLSEKSMNEFIAGLDKNGDGEIDFVEFLVWFEKFEF